MVTLNELREQFVSAYDATTGFLLLSRDTTDAKAAAEWSLAAKNTASVMHSLAMVQKAVRFGREPAA